MDNCITVVSLDVYKDSIVAAVLPSTSNRPTGTIPEAAIRDLGSPGTAVAVNSSPASRPPRYPDGQQSSFLRLHDFKLDVDLRGVLYAVPDPVQLPLRRDLQGDDLPGRLVADSHQQPAAAGIADAHGILRHLPARQESRFKFHGLAF